MIFPKGTILIFAYGQGLRMHLKGRTCGLTHFLYFVVNGSIFGTVFYLFLLTSYPR